MLMPCVCHECTFLSIRYVDGLHVLSILVGLK